MHNKHSLKADSGMVWVQEWRAQKRTGQILDRDVESKMAAHSVEPRQEIP